LRSRKRPDRGNEGTAAEASVRLKARNFRLNCYAGWDGTVRKLPRGPIVPAAQSVRRGQTVARSEAMDKASQSGRLAAREFIPNARPKTKDITHCRRKGMRRVSLARLIRSAYLLYFSKPVSDRALLKAVRGRPVRSIVELGVSLPARTPRLLEIAGWRREGETLRYTGIDLFEARPSGQTRLPLKQAFATLQGPHVRLQLVPGDPATALRRVANSLVGTDLMVISGEQSDELLASAWTWMPRMLTSSSIVLREVPGAAAQHAQWQRLTLADVQRLGASAAKSARRAA
jgi:hypothetical protein